MKREVGYYGREVGYYGRGERREVGGGKIVVRREKG